MRFPAIAGLIENAGKTVLVSIGAVRETVTELTTGTLILASSGVVVETRIVVVVNDDEYAL